MATDSRRAGLRNGALAPVEATMQGITHIAPTAGVVLILQDDREHERTRCIGGWAGSQAG